jgi:hypothetical protein
MNQPGTLTRIKQVGGVLAITCDFLEIDEGEGQDGELHPCSSRQQILGNRTTGERAGDG